MKTIELLRDVNMVPIPNCIPLSDPQDVDGTAVSAVCINPIDSELVRIKSIDNALRIAVGPSTQANPLAVEADGIQISAGDEIYQPCNAGDFVAVLGGKANICACGK